MNHFFLVNEMIVIASNFWNIDIGPEKGEVTDDDVEMTSTDQLGENMLWLLPKMKYCPCQQVGYV